MCVCVGLWERRGGGILNGDTKLLVAAMFNDLLGHWE